MSDYSDMDGVDPDDLEEEDLHEMMTSMLNDPRMGPVLRMMLSGDASAMPQAGHAGHHTADARMSGLPCGHRGSHGSQQSRLPPPPAAPFGLLVRLDLHDADPPIYRCLELPSDMTLLRLHYVIQAAMGWANYHCHKFRSTYNHRTARCFSTGTEMDDDDDDETFEGDVRLDQLLTKVGDNIWYEYDFGDGWDHVIKVEKVLDKPPAQVRCVSGCNACPPEDCGGLDGYEVLAEWVRSGYQDDLLPEQFEDAEAGREWLPSNWHPDKFDVDKVNAALPAAVLAGPCMALDDMW